MKDPAVKLKKIRDTLIKDARDNITTVIERFSINAAEPDIRVNYKTPKSKLPLFSEGSYGETNKILATAMLNGEPDPIFSEAVYEALSQSVEETFINDDHSSIEVLNYCQGKLYIISSILKQIGERKVSDICYQWAMLGAD